MPPTFPIQSTLPAPVHRLRGFDASKYSVDVDFRRFKQEGYDFVILRASVDTKADPTFQKYVKAARDADLIVGPYHAFFDHKDPIAQALFYFSVCKMAGLTEPSSFTILPSNDYETFHSPSGSEYDRPSANQKIEGCNRARTFQVEIERLWEREENDSLFYTYPSFFDMIPDCASKRELAKRKLWIAHYTTGEKPKVPKPFTDWDLWQYLGNQHALGTYVDFNYAKGDASSLPLLRPGRRQEKQVLPDGGLQTGDDTDRIAATTLQNEIDRIRAAEFSDDEPRDSKRNTPAATPTAKTSESQRLAKIREDQLKKESDS